MAHRGNFRGKRHSPYSNRPPWKDRNHGGGAGDRENRIVVKEERNDPFGEVQVQLGGEQRNSIEHPAGEERTEMLPFNPTEFAEKGRREKKFGNRARLYVGNLPRGMTEDELRQLFGQFGETEQIYIEKEKNFGFVRMVCPILPG